jgi:opacity protein-like surface antigen
MKAAGILLAAGLGLCVGLPASAQYVGVLQSAETMDRGTFKLMAAPIMAFGKNGAKDESGLAVRGGYGFTDRFDAEAKLGFFQNGTFVGADGELWLVKGKEKDTGIDLSIAGGVHWMSGKKNYADTRGFELTPLLSGHLDKSWELYAALDASFEKIKDVPPGVDDTFTRTHLVPGIEYGVSDEIDLVGEVGIGLNDNSSTYVGAGIAFYLR